MRIDERDIMFSRMARQAGTPAYDDYYERHPEHLETDERLRQMPQLCGVGTTTYDPLNSPMVGAAFHFLDDIKHLADGPPASAEQTEGTPEQFTSRVKGLAAHYGAVLSGVARLDASYYYSHRGRQEASYGEPLNPEHSYTFVYAVEMEEALVHTAPLLPQSLAVTKGYVDAAVIGMVLTYYIKSLGYDARAHVDGNYLMVMPLAAKAAGLGDVGRHGLLVTERYGPRVRLGAVTTNLPLIADGPSDFDLQVFCELCGKCAKSCLAQAIPNGNKTDAYWQIKQESCYEKWRVLGTDCGVCLSACPFSVGLPQELIDAYKRSDEGAKTLLSFYEEKHASRPINRAGLEWLK